MKSALFLFPRPPPYSHATPLLTPPQINTIPPPHTFRRSLLPIPSEGPSPHTFRKAPSSSSHLQKAPSSSSSHLQKAPFSPYLQKALGGGFEFQVSLMKVCKRLFQRFKICNCLQQMHTTHTHEHNTHHIFREQFLGHTHMHTTHTTSLESSFLDTHT